jgi:hypothetical protein
MEYGFISNISKYTLENIHGDCGMQTMLFSVSKKTKEFKVFDKKEPNTRVLKFLKPRSLPFVNDCFKNENSAVVGVFLQRLFMSMCRYKGIPARWQSGWMLHPGHVNLHDWYEGVGWIPVDVSFKLQKSKDERIREFYISGIDAYRFIVNKDFGCEFCPPKSWPHSEPWDFRRGKVEWEEGNLYFDDWSYDMEVTYAGRL